MKKKNIILALLVMSTCVTSIFAQKEQRSFFSNLAISGGASTTGYRFDVAIPVSDKFTLRGGTSFFDFQGDTDLDVSSATEYEKYLPYTPQIAIDGDLSMKHNHLLIDFTPAKQGVFHITAGVFFGNTELVANGLLVNPQTKKSIVGDLQKAGYPNQDLPDFTLEDKYTIKPNKNGSIDAKIEMGSGVKPYFGIGLGRSVPKKRVGLKFDLGLLYQGKPEISSPNLVKGDLNDYIKDSKDLKDYEGYFSFWPILNLQLTIRLF